MTWLPTVGMCGRAGVFRLWCSSRHRLRCIDSPSAAEAPHPAPGQPHPAPELIRLKNLEKIFRDLPAGATELACHPAYLSSDLDSPYASEREIELATLLNPRVLSLARELDIVLVNFATLPTLLEKNNVAA